MSWPRNSLDCDYCKEFREWNDNDMKQIEAAKLHGEMWTAHIGAVVIPRCREFTEHCKRYHTEKPRKTFAFTFTTNLNTQLEVQKEMCFAAYKLFLQNTTPVEEGEVFLEYTEEGRPHLHGWYVTVDGGRIFAKTFRRCWSYWGEKDRQKRFAGGFHEEMKTNRYKGYASAEGRKVVSKEKGADVFYHGAQADKYHFGQPSIEEEIEAACRIVDY